MTFPTSLPIPDPVLKIARKLEEAGHETWCVGGAVRDNLLEEPNQDFDLATAATPDVVRKLFRRTVPIGIEHGTVAVLDDANTPHEVTTFRRDVKTDGRHAVVEFGVSLDDDLARRDFTINAIAYHPIKRSWRDPFGGKADLEGHVLRAVGDPAARFREDYLRILRALRFAARFGFAIEPETWAAAQEAAGGLRHLSAERVRDEWFKGLKTARDPAELVRLWGEIGAIGIWLPELQEQGARSKEQGATGEAQGARRKVHGARGDAIRAIGGGDPVLLTAFLSSEPEKTLRRLRCSNAEIERGRRIGEHRGMWPDAASERSVRHWLATVGDAAGDLVAIAMAEGRDGELAEAVEAVRRSGAPLAVGDLAVTGNDLLEVGVERGPEVGRILRALLERVLDEPALNTRETLLRWVRAQGAGSKEQGAGG